MEHWSKYWRQVLLALMTAVCLVAGSQQSKSNMTETRSEQQLYVLVTGPYPDPDEKVWDAGISLIPAVRLAFQQINYHSNILKGYRLELLEENSGCQFKHKVFKSFVKGRYYNRPRILATIGPGCSDTTLAIAPLLARPEVNLLQIAPTATSPRIEALNYNTTFTMIASFLALTNQLVMLMKCNQWLGLGILLDEYGTPDYYKPIIENVEKQLSSLTGYNLSYVHRIYDSDLFPVEQVLHGGTRIVLVIAGQILQKIICLAYHLNMTYPQYQWIFTERPLNDFVTNLTFEHNGKSYTCSQETMASAANGSILINYSLVSESDATIAETGLNYSAYRKLYTQFFHQHWEEPKVQAILNQVIQETDKKKEDFEPSGVWENAYYDAGWALGFALDELAKEGHSLSKLIAEEPDFTQLLTEKLLTVSFSGATGPIRFSPQTQSVATRIMITQVLKNQSTDELSEQLLSGGQNCPSKFGFIRYNFSKNLARVHKIIGAAIIFFTCLLTIILGLLQIGYILWRQKKSIKAESPKITHLSFLGCYFFALAAVFYTVQKTFLTKLDMDTVYPAMCSAIMWFLMLGSSLILGTISVKVWRIYKLFKHFRSKSPGVLLKDKVLVLFIGILLLTDIILCLGWTHASPWEVEKTVVNDRIQKLKYHTLSVTLSCTCVYVEYWIAGIAVYKGGLFLMLVTLSILNRKIQRKHFSHTKKVNSLVYSLTILGGVGFPLWFLLKNEFTIILYAPYLLLTAFFLLTLLLCTLLLFLPPVIPILKSKLSK